MPLIQQGQNLSTIAAQAGMTPAQFAALNPQFAGQGAGYYQGLANNVQVGQSYNVNPPANTPPVNTPPTTTTPPPANTTPAQSPISTLFSNYATNNQSYSTDPQYKNALKIYQGGAYDMVDEKALRSEKLKELRDRINAINQIYDQQLGKVRLEGKGRIGSNVAISAARGLAGSMRGQALGEGVLDYNRQIEAAVDAERNQAVQAVMDLADQYAVEEAARRRQALEAGAKEYITYIRDQEKDKQTGLNTIAAALYAQGIDPTTMTEAELTEATKKLKGISNADILSAYQKVKLERDAENLKNFPTKELSQGEALYQYDQKTGEYKQVGYNPKTTTAKASGSGSSMGGSIGGGSGSSAYGNDLDAIIGATVVTIGSKFGQEQFNKQLSKARNDADRINLIASTVLKNSPSELKTDFSNQSIAVSNIDKAIAEIDKGAKTGVINNALQKGFNLVGKDYDPQMQAVAAYIVSAIQPYRNSVTGAAWGTQEENEYQQLFGSTVFSPAELKQRLERLKGIMVNKSAQGLNTFVNPLNTYQNPFAPVNNQNMNIQSSNMVTVYSIKTGKSAQIPANKLQQALSSGLFRQ